MFLDEDAYDDGFVNTLKELIIDPIHADPLSDPYIVEEGQTFEKTTLENLKSVDAIGQNPISRNNFNINEIRPNILLKEIIEAISKVKSQAPHAYRDKKYRS